MKNFIAMTATSILLTPILSGCGSTAMPPSIEGYAAPPDGYNQQRETFNPPPNMRTERTWIMSSDGYDTGKLHSVRTVEPSESTPRIMDVLNSTVSIKSLHDVQASEVLWIGPTGLSQYTGEFSVEGKVSEIKAELIDSTLHYEFQETPSSRVKRMEFIENKDYHWSTVYLSVRNRELVRGKRYSRQLLDVSFARLMPVEEVYLGMKTFEVDGHALDCHVIWFDYGHLHGTVWIAEDELGEFLVYEDAVATEGAFKIALDSYSITR